MSDQQPLELPAVVSWPIFPFEGDMQVRELQPRHEQERTRNGDPGGDPCHRCADPTDGRLWSKGRWAISKLRFGDDPAPFPAYMLETVACLDIDDLDDTHAAELGLMTIRLQGALMSLGTVGRVHFNRWGDGARHFHVWFLGRPAGAWQFSGYTLPLWGFTLPPLSDEEHAANDAALLTYLDAHPL